MKIEGLEFSRVEWIPAEMHIVFEAKEKGLKISRYDPNKRRNNQKSIYDPHIFQQSSSKNFPHKQSN